MAEPMPGVGDAVTVMISKPLRPSGRSASFAQDVSQHPPGPATRTRLLVGEVVYSRGAFRNPRYSGAVAIGAHCRSRSGPQL